MLSKRVPKKEPSKPEAPRQPLTKEQQIKHAHA